MNEDHLLSRKRILSATAFVVIAILLSKISGLVRDQVMTGYFGVSYDTDAFMWADYIPNLFRILFAESLIIAAFIPIYSAYLKKGKKDDLKVFVNSIINIIVLVFLALSAAIFIFSPEIGVLLSKIARSDFDMYKFVVMNRIIIFSLVTMSLSSLATGILNSHNIFTVPSLAPFVMNIVTIISVILFYGRIDIYSMAVGVMAGSVMHLLIQLPQLRASPMRYRFKINFRHHGVREIAALTLPILLSLGAVHLNNSIDYFFALNLGGGNTTALNLSWRVANLPLGVFSVAIVTVLYPLISRQAAVDDIKGIKESFSLGVREIGYMMLPATAGLAILNYPVIKVLFERFSFGAADTEKVSYILIFHSLGLVFFGLLMILNRVFYAFKNVKTPLKVASISIVVNLFLDWILIKFMDVGGLALSTSLVALCNVVILIVILRKKVGNVGGRRIFKSFGKIIASTAVMSVIIFFLWNYIERYAYRGIWPLILFLLLTIVTGIGVYVGCTILLGMEEVKFVFGLFKKFKKKA
ncbi:MAG: murein biosynthesis integral membrane protein MurJ [Actinomycetota bacterium]|nr:murein biosynthesis integral membrane protein MurJ [Actinomycetota bacterium]